ncbi:MAG: hypothetical protein MUE33_00830 [Cytophagaceae bacterium]|nr:hypothetical protein [Cytophagaceae bacterium]
MYTAYVPALLFVVVIDSVSIALAPENYKYTTAFTFSSFLGNLFQLQDFPFMKSINILDFTSFGSARTFWTLAIEWWIYIWFGYIVFVIMKKKSISIFSLLLLFALSIAPLYHLVSGRGNGLTAFWLMGAGVWILSKTFPMATFTKIGKLLLIVLLVCFALGRAYIKMTAYDPIFALLLACILFLSIDIVKDIRFHPKVEQLIRLNANYSFTLYLIHYSTLDFIVTHWGNVYSPYLLFFIGCVMSNVISFMMGYVFEVILTPVVKKYLYSTFLKV